MSWSRTAKLPVGIKQEEVHSALMAVRQEADVNGVPNPPTRQFEAAAAAAEVLIEGGAIGEVGAHALTVNMAGHENTPHGPGDSVSVSVMIPWPEPATS